MKVKLFYSKFRLTRCFHGLSMLSPRDFNAQFKLSRTLHLNQLTNSIVTLKFGSSQIMRLISCISEKKQTIQTLNSSDQSPVSELLLQSSLITASHSHSKLCSCNERLPSLLELSGKVRSPGQSGLFHLETCMTLSNSTVSVETFSGID